MYRSDPTAAGTMPWDLAIRNVSLSSIPVTVEVHDLSGETPEEVVSCTATSERHEELVFEDLPPDRRYRVQAVLHRPDRPEEASTTLRWTTLSPDSALRVTVDGAEGFRIERYHYDG